MSRPGSTIRHGVVEGWVADISTGQSPWGLYDAFLIWGVNVLCGLLEGLT